MAGNIFEDPPPKADVITMGHILHDWNLNQKTMLVGKAYEAIEPDRALVVYDAIIDNDHSQNAFGLPMSLNMLIETPGGFDYTGSDCMGWMQEAGFRERRVEQLVGLDSMWSASSRGSHEYERQPVLKTSASAALCVSQSCSPLPTDCGCQSDRFSVSPRTALGEHLPAKAPLVFHLVVVSNATNQTVHVPRPRSTSSRGTQL